MAEHEPLGELRFRKKANVTRSGWLKYWPRWSDALKEAGLVPNRMQSSLGSDTLLQKLAELARQLGKFPTNSEVCHKASSDPDFPSHNTFSNRLGRRDEQRTRLIDFCRTHPEYQDVVGLCEESDRVPTPAKRRDKGEATSKPLTTGSVYLFKYPRGVYKIGMSSAVGRRIYELERQGPEKGRKVHEIRVAHPEAVEKYLHTVFREKWTHGEFFRLDADDIREFKIEAARFTD